MGDLCRLHLYEYANGNPGNLLDWSGYLASFVDCCVNDKDYTSELWNDISLAKKRAKKVLADMDASLIQWKDDAQTCLNELCVFKDMGEYNLAVTRLNHAKEVLTNSEEYLSNSAVFHCRFADSSCCNGAESCTGICSAGEINLCKQYTNGLTYERAAILIHEASHAVGCTVDNYANQEETPRNRESCLNHEGPCSWDQIASSYEYWIVNNKFEVSEPGAPLPQCGATGAEVLPLLLYWLWRNRKSNRDEKRNEST